MGGPGSGRKPTVGGKTWGKKAASADKATLIKMRIRKAPSKYPHISGFNIKSKKTGGR